MESIQGVGMPESRAEPSLESAFRRFNEAFNRFDTRQVAACWTEDGTLISPTGEVGRGRSGVEAVYRHDCESILEGTRSRLTITSARRLGQDLAFVDGEHELQTCRKPDGSRGTMTIHLVILAKRSGAGWRWMDVRPYAFLPKQPSVH